MLVSIILIGDWNWELIMDQRNWEVSLSVGNAGRAKSNSSPALMFFHSFFLLCFICPFIHYHYLQRLLHYFHTKHFPLPIIILTSFFIAFFHTINYCIYILWKYKTSSNIISQFWYMTKWIAASVKTHFVAVLSVLGIRPKIVIDI